MVNDKFGIFRSWADNTHVAHQDIEELRKFIQFGSSQKRPEIGDAHVAARAQFTIYLVRIVHHGSELEHPELFSKPAHSTAGVKNGSSGLEFDQACYQ
jgi:hypothetical protein